MEKKCLVSIITPCYNAEDFIAFAIESVLQQTYADWEMIIVDDCSTDKSAAIVKKYAEKDSRIKYLCTKYSSGSPALPRNMGIKAARGRYIAFLDSDDMWFPTKLESQINTFDQCENAAIVFSNYEKMEEDGRRSERIVSAPDNITYRRLLHGNVIGCCTGMYDVAKVGKIYMERIGHEDYVLWLKILRMGYIAKNTNDTQALYRLRARSISANKLRALRWQWNVYINSEKTGYLKGCYYFVSYALKAIAKSMK